MNDPKKNDNVPPNSRLFIVCGKSVTEDDFKETFGAFGQVDSVQLHKDRKGDSKGIVYVKFSKTSEAARAVEEMNGRCLGQHPRPLKVMIANSKEQGNGRENNEEERLLRLFVVVPKDTMEDELKNYFDTFGTVQYVNIVRDRETKESKGFAYIKFYRLVHAAAAYELCEKSYKAVFAEPRPQRPQNQGEPPHGHHPQHTNQLQHLNNGFRNNRNGSSVTSQPGRAESCRLTVTGSSAINEDQLWRLFDLIPGLDYCEVREVCQSAHRIVGLAVYTSPAAAAYARKKLHGFEYPPGQRLIVRYEEGGVYITPSPLHHMTPSPAASTPPPSLPLTGDLQSLADTIAHATSLLQAAQIHERVDGAPPLHFSREGGAPPLHYPPPVTPLTIPAYDPAYCSISLPSPQPLVPMETTVGERLFLVCTPSPPPLYALKDVFSRFGGLIDVYLLQGKRCGYALFSSAEAAGEAKTALNGQEVMGVRVKVLLAEPSRNMEREQDRRSPLA